MSGELILLIFFSTVIALAYLCIRHKKPGGLVSVIGFASLAVTCTIKAVFQIYARMGILGFPSSMEKLKESSEQRLLMTQKAEAMTPWIILSAAVLAIGLVWFLFEIIKAKKGHSCQN